MSRSGPTLGDRISDQAGDLFRRGLPLLGITLDDQVRDQLVCYALELHKWNKKVNLVAKDTSLADIVEKHFLDSLTLLPVLAANAATTGTLLDIGSGAGFPGLVIKTACPERPVTLLEPRQRRVSFLNHIIRTLGLSGIDVVPHRTDEKDALPDVRFEVITSRAVADVHSFLAMTGHLSSQGTLVVCMQGASGQEQWEGEKDNPLFARLKLEKIRLPFSKAQRFILLFKKR